MVFKVVVKAACHPICMCPLECNDLVDGLKNQKIIKSMPLIMAHVM